MTQQKKSLNKLMRMLEHAEEPFDEQAVAMDCKDDCEEIAAIAERVAKGERLRDLFPAYAEHLDMIDCSKEEFEALVSVLRAELESRKEE